MVWTSTAWALAALSAAAALAFGFFFLAKPPTPARAALKTAFMGALVVALVLVHAPTLLIVAALASAAGDAALAFDKPFVLPIGILSFLIAQVCYLLLFRQLSLGMAPDGARFVLMAAVAWFAVVFLLWLWPRLGALAWGVVPYTAAIAAMAMSAMALPAAGWPAMLGAASFFVSDATLSAELFKLEPNAPARKITAPVVWWTYVAAQALIIWGMLRLLQAH